MLASEGMLANYDPSLLAEQLGMYSVSLLGLRGTPGESERLQFAGSGTCVRVGDDHHILTAEHVLEEDVLPSVTFYNFAVLRDGIYLVPQADAEGGYGIHFFNFATGKTRPVMTVSGAVTPGLSVSPDGRTLLYGQTDEMRGDLMLVEDFR